MVSTALAFVKVTVPGPSTMLQVVWAGPPPPLTVPSRLAAAGMVTVRLGPAFTVGVVSTVMTTSSKPLSAPSFAVSRSV